LRWTANEARLKEKTPEHFAKEAARQAILQLGAIDDLRRFRLAGGRVIGGGDFSTGLFHGFQGQSGPEVSHERPSLSTAPSRIRSAKSVIHRICA